MRGVKLFGVLGLGILLGAGAGAAFWYTPGDAVPDPGGAFPHTTPLTAAPAPMVDSPAPEFSLPGMDGEPIRLSALRGQTVILAFWATWCEPCLGELPLLDRIAADRPESLAVLGINAGEPEESVRPFVDALETGAVRFLLDPAGEVRGQYLVRGLPTTFFIDSEGVIRRIKIGALDFSIVETTLDSLGAKS
ncbi:MAG: TlpA family protein disulfide reductase [Anaerolineales bacterium]|nr:TlpA family protein disulfide reductase [Anaerolineales bacterium]